MDTDHIVQLLTTYEGRINRAKFWLAAGIFLAAQIAVAILSYILESIGLSFVGLAISFIVGLAVAVCGVFIGIKRLHDRAKSGWWLLLFFLAPGILAVLGIYIPVIGIVFSLAALAVYVWGFVELGCLKGDNGPNAYGSDPLQM